jgi:SpoVK/Ycf46/Vps4 family AAA+-type ATPase
MSTDIEDEEIMAPKSKYSNYCVIWKESTQVYCIRTASTTINSVEATSDNINSLLRSKPEEIFDSFDEKTDFIDYDIFGLKTFIKHLRGKKPKNSDLPIGVYKVDSADYSNEISLAPLKLEMDEYIPLDGHFKTLVDDINIFMNKREEYEEAKLIHKRGCLLYGPPGNGKTFHTLHTSKEVIKKYGCTVFIIPQEVAVSSALLNLKQFMEGKNSMIVLEEISARTAADKTYEGLLNFLDGEWSWRNCYVVATTNYPDKLPLNIVDRPGRFDLMLEIPEPGEEIRQKYINHFFPGEDNRSFVMDTKGLSISYIKEIILRSKLYNLPPREVLKDIAERRKKVSSKFCKPGGNYK